MGNFPNYGSVPKLRFSEFKDKWENKKLGDLMTFKVTNSYSRDNLNYESGTVKNIHYGDIHTKFQTLFDLEKENVPYINKDISLNRISEDLYCQEGDVIFADASEDLNDVGKSIEIINLDGEKLLSGLHTLLARPQKNNFSKGFLGYLLKSDFVRNQIKREAQGSKVLSINVGRISNIHLSFPSISEQQKISEFLSHLDKRILCSMKIIEKLETLMKASREKIFSQKLRFKDEYGSDFPKWKTITLGEVGNIITGKTPSTKDENLWNGEIQFVTPTDIKDNKYQYFTERSLKSSDKLNILPEKSIMFTCIASIGKMSLSSKPCVTNQQINSLIPNSNYDNEFIFYAIANISDYIKSTQSSSTMPIINKTEFSKFKIFGPTLKEQTKIANFLSSIQEKIETEKQILEKLELQKKFLLANLFV